MIATILPGSENFYAVGYNERKVSKGTAHLLEMRNFGAVGVIQPDTPDEKVRFLQEVGFTQVVLARELSLNQIREIAEQTTVPLEVFVHGALCVSYSG